MNYARTHAKTQILGLIVLSLATILMSDQGRATVTAFVNTSVIDMESGHVLTGRTVLVENGAIVRISPSDEASVPNGAEIISGDGKYLMPGLADMHIHLVHTDEFVSYLAYGITTVMNLGERKSQALQYVDYKRELASEARLGPTFYTTAGQFEGERQVSDLSWSYALKTPEEARERVRWVAENGFDFIKIYNGLTKPLFHAVVDEARRNGLPVVGHIPRGSDEDRFDAEESLSGGLNMVAHAEEFFFTFFEGPRDTQNMDRSYRPDYGEIPYLVDLLKQGDVAVTPHLIGSYSDFIQWEGRDTIWSDPEMRYFHPDLERSWRGSTVHSRDHQENFIFREQIKYTLLQELTRQFNEAGVLLLLGSDSITPGNFSGKAAYMELTELVKAGLSNFEALATGTRNAGMFVARYQSDERFGLVKEGYRADLLLLDANPLENIHNIRDIAGVMARGRWLPRAELDDMREQMAVRYAGQRVFNAELGELVAEAAESESSETVLAAFANTHSDDREALVALEREVNIKAYGLIGENRNKDALAFFRFNTERFPDSANTWDSLAEAYWRAGDLDSARRYYAKALEVDPAWTNAERMLEQISKE